VLVLVLEWKHWSGLQGSHVGLVGIVTESAPGATQYQTFEHEHEDEHEDEDEHDFVATIPVLPAHPIVGRSLGGSPGAARLDKPL